MLFALASLACGLAQWPIMLIAARIVLGAAGALVSPAALSLLTTVNPEGLSTSCAIEYGTSTAYGATVPCEPAAMDHKFTPSRSNARARAAVSRLRP